MVNLGKIHVGDVRTELQLLVQDTSVSDVNSPLDLSLVTGMGSAIQMIISDPSDNENTYSATVLNAPGTDGIIKFITTTPSIWDEPGFWKKRASITYSDGSHYESNDIIFEVL